MLVLLLSYDPSLARWRRPPQSNTPEYTGGEAEAGGNVSVGGTAISQDTVIDKLLHYPSLDDAPLLS